ncbi:MAG TPA: HAMP domain-containing sensor histidine kinase [Hyphomicrobium sp.]
MTALKPAIAHAHGSVSGIDLAGDTRPVITIDLDAAEIIAANTSGVRALGLFAYASFPIALDASMPALARLRQLAALGNPGEGKAERLTFLSNGRLRPISCTVTRLANGRSGVFVLRIIDEKGNEPPLAAANAPGNGDSQLAPTAQAAPAASGDVAAQILRSDAETLKEIAQQIREGNFTKLISEPVEANAALSLSDRLSPIGPDDAAPHAALPQHRPASILDPDHLAKLAHELKTPLTAIAAAAEVMRDERLGEMGNDRYLSYAADIHENATHALDVITSLLSESAKTTIATPRLIALDLNALVERTVSSIQALAQSRGLTLAVEAEKNLSHVVANPTSLRQILLNLLTNAIKFTPRDGDVRVVTGYLADGRVFLVVRDTGCGMNGEMAAPEVSDDPAQPWLNGNGIGLPLVQRLVREMSAEFEIDSAPGKGTVALIAFGGFARWSA